MRWLGRPLGFSWLFGASRGQQICHHRICSIEKLPAARDSFSHHFEASSHAAGPLIRHLTSVAHGRCWIIPACRDDPTWSRGYAHQESP